MSMPVQLFSRTLKTQRNTTHYLEAGPRSGPLMIFLHGWPEMGLVWRAQLEAFAADGWHCVAPDLRGFGRSSAATDIHAYTMELIVQDMVELHDHLGGQPALWVGHDWGCVVAGSLVAHHPARSRGVVFVSLAYQPAGHALATVVPLVDRAIYSVEQYPDGQWDYYRYYTTHFESAVADLDADKAASLASIFRAGDPASVGKVSPQALVTEKGGRFGAAHRAPAAEPDPSLWPDADFDELVRSFEQNGFRPSCAWYMNDEAALAYARTAPNGGRIEQPVLFVNGDFDQICTIFGNKQGDPMRAACPDLTIVSLSSGHWLPLERKAELVFVMRDWLVRKGLADDRSESSHQAEDLPRGRIAANPDLVEELYSAFNRRDIDGALSLMSETVQLRTASEGGSVGGMNDIRAFWTRQWLDFDPIVTPIATRFVDGKLSVRVHQVVHSKAGELLSDSEVDHVYTLVGDVVQQMQLGSGDAATEAFRKAK